MRLSTRTRYGCRALVELAAVYPERPITLQRMADSQHLSVKYLGNIMTALKLAGLVRPVRGARGGYCLAKSPAALSLREVYEALEGSPAPVDCVDDPHSCPLEATCPTRETWVEMKNALVGVLERTTLQHLVARKQRKELQAREA